MPFLNIQSHVINHKLINLIEYYKIQIINVTVPGMLVIVTRLFFVVGHGSLEMRLEGGRRLVSGMLHSLYNNLYNS